MNICKDLGPIIGAIAFLFMIGSASAADLSKPKGTVDNIRQAEPPKVSTTTKESPLGQPTTDYQPKGPSVNPVEPPSPSTGTSSGSSDCHPSLGWRTREALGC